MDTIRLSKYLAFILRHNPEDCGIVLDQQGWTDFNQLLAKVSKKFNAEVMKRDIEQIVKKDAKMRYSIENSSIRANQGHSIPGIVAFELVPKVPPNILYHGTTTEKFETIKEEGLKPMKRHHVHLSPTHGQAHIVAIRWKGQTPMVLVINAKLMIQDGHKFYVSDNGVWMTDHVPPEFIYD